jgi:FkbM family methyltransferase
MRLYHYPKGVKGRLSCIEKKYSDDAVAVSDGDLVIDIGANIGEFSSAVISRANRLFAIDPDPNVRETLSRNLRSFPNATILPYALSDTDSEVEFYLSTKQADSSLIQPKQFSKTVTVRAMRLDSLIAEHGIERIDFLKLEAEGWEPEILAGATRALGLTQKIAVDAGPERYGQPTAKDVLRTLSAAGFDVSHRGDMVFAWRSKP